MTPQELAAQVNGLGDVSYLNPPNQGGFLRPVKQQMDSVEYDWEKRRKAYEVLKSQGDPAADTSEKLQDVRDYYATGVLPQQIQDLYTRQGREIPQPSEALMDGSVCWAWTEAFLSLPEGYYEADVYIDGCVCHTHCFYLPKCSVSATPTEVKYKNECDTCHTCGGVGFGSCNCHDDCCSAIPMVAVSYTHLTLPTIYSV